jgi:hypothetical protein
MLAIRKYVKSREFESMKDISQFDRTNLAIDLKISFEILEKHLKLEVARNRRIQKMGGEKLKSLNIEKLKNFYKTTSNHPDEDSLKYLSDQLNMDRKTILKWFNNERYKNRNENKMKTILIGINSNHLNYK